MKKIIVVKPKSLNANDKQKLQNEGHVIIEHEEPYRIIEQLPPWEYVAEVCLSCGETFYIRADLQKHFKKSHKYFHCPNGHSQHYS